MNKNLVQTLKGFRDFLPEEKRQRDFVAKKITQAFELAGFEPVETPTLEYASLLLGKYGDEADQLVYQFADRGGREIALRYDQTVPTARLLVEKQNELPRAFRRYQIQNVFRADKPQAGRFREFTQCDCDIFGSTSPLADAEILAVYYQAFAQIGLTDLIIEINDRQTLLKTLSEFATDQVSVLSIIQSIDKLDKNSVEEVVAELVDKGLTQDKAKQSLSTIKQATQSDNLSEIIKIAQELGVPENSLVFKPTLARGLDYYTGMIFEGIVPGYEVGSVGGGGRYDNLIEDLSGLKMPAVGFGIGFDRTVEAAAQLDLIPNQSASAQVLVTIFDKDLQSKSLKITQQLRQAGISTELYPGLDDLSKQLKTANQKQIPFVIIIGQEEAKNNKITLKDMKTGEQLTDLVEAIFAKILK